MEELADRGADRLQGSVILMQFRFDVINQIQNIDNDGLLLCGQLTKHLVQSQLGFDIDFRGNTLAAAHMLDEQENREK